MNTISLSPAYQRDYRNKAEVIAAFNSDADFRVDDIRVRGTYANRSDLIGSEFTHAQIRYGRMTKVVIVPIGGDNAKRTK